MGGSVRPGNQCLFLLFISFNFLVFLASMGIFGSAIYLFVRTKNANVFGLSFLGIGAFLLIMTTCAFKLRESIHLLGCYLFILLVIFTAMLILSLVLLINTHQAKEWAHEAAEKLKNAGNIPAGFDEPKYEELIRENIVDVSYAFLIFTLIIGLTMAFGWCYRNSTLDKTFAGNEKLLAQKKIEKS